MISVLEAAAVLATGVLAYLLTRYFSVKFNHMGITGADVHKKDRPVRAEMGGLAILVSLLAGAFLLFLFEIPLSPLFLAGVATVALIALIGVADDLFGMKQRYKPFLIAAASAPLAYELLQRTTIELPLLGHIPFGILYPLAVVPLGLATSANFSNMFAGFNGLEAGCTAIATGSLALLAFMRDQLGAALLGLLLTAGFIGFLKLNWYPARIFPGDTGTLMAGAGVATVGFMSGLEFAAIVVSTPAALDFTLKMLSRRPFSHRRLYGDTKITDGGTLEAPRYPALAHAFMRASPMTESRLVLCLLSLEVLYSLLAIAVSLGFFHLAFGLF
jgi:UDP-N-acetylglucosamine--dolichyl-phosphate N-acetylglucosaminephosphotransferase